MSPSRAAAFDARPGARVTLTLTDRRADEEKSSPPVNHLPWEVRFAVCVSRPGSIYGTTERVLGEGVLNLAEFTDSVHGKRVSEKRVEVRMAMGGNEIDDDGASSLLGRTHPSSTSSTPMESKPKSSLGAGWR